MSAQLLNKYGRSRTMTDDNKHPMIDINPAIITYNMYILCFGFYDTIVSQDGMEFNSKATQYNFFTTQSEFEVLCKIYLTKQQLLSADDLIISEMSYCTTSMKATITARESWESEEDDFTYELKIKQLVKVNINNESK
jgi:hypothetical protein